MSILPLEIERKVLKSLLFVESFDTLVEETKESEYLVADVLKWLIEKKYVSPMQLDEESQNYKKTYMYDSDNMRAYNYQITAKGLGFIGSKF